MRGLACVLLLGALALAGCGAQALEDEPLSLDEVAAETRAQPYRFELTMEVEGLKDAFSLTATGAADPSADRGTVRYASRDGGDEITIEVRRVGDRTYTRIDPGAWMEEGTAESDQLSGPFGAFSEPHRAVEALARHGRDVETSVGEDIAGVPTVRYRATVPVIELFGSELTGEERKDLETEIRESGADTTEVDAWADADGVLLRLAFAFPIRQDGREGRLASTTRFFDLGQPVEVEPPPPSELERPFADGPCNGPAVPHRPQTVLEALRADGFEAHAGCNGGETLIFVVSTVDDYGFSCLVARSARDATGYAAGFDDPVLAANVACDPGTEYEQTLRRVRTLLAGL